MGVFLLGSAFLKIFRQCVLYSKSAPKWGAGVVAAYMVILGSACGLHVPPERPASAETKPALKLILDPNRRAQTMDGFGASDAWTIEPAISLWQETGHTDATQQLADWLFSSDHGIGLSLWRFNIGAGSAEQGHASRIADPYRRAELMVSKPDALIDTTKQLGQIHFAQLAAAQGVNDMVAFINSPPVWATKNGLAHPGSRADIAHIGSTNLRADQYEAFARFQAKVVAYLRTEAGLPITYLSPINEPTWHWTDQTQEGNRYNNEEMLAVYRATHTALKDSNLLHAVEIDAGETVEYRAALSDDETILKEGKAYTAGMNTEGFGNYRNYIDALLGDQQMQAIVGNKISLHGYWSDTLPDRLVPLRERVRAAVKKTSPAARIWMSEFCILGPAEGIRPFDGHGFNPDDMDFALHIARTIHLDLVHMDASAWFWWLAVTAYDYKDGLLKISSSLDPATLQPSKTMWALGNFSRHVRPGYVRLRTEQLTQDDYPGVMASVYVSDDTSKWVIVAVNTTTDTRRLALVAPNQPNSVALPTQWKMHLTDANHDLATIATIKDTELSVPARSVATFTANRDIR